LFRFRRQDACFCGGYGRLIEQSEENANTPKGHPEYGEEREERIVPKFTKTS
jgi:hypothetical protein